MQAPESDEEQQRDEASPPTFDTLSGTLPLLQPTPLATFTNFELMDTVPPPGIDRFR